MNKRFFCLTGILLALGLMALLLPGAVRAAGSVAINSTNFPDNNFRKYVSEKYDWNSNGYLDSDEIEYTDRMYITGDFVLQNLKGIEYFTELTDFSCYGNQLTELDLSKNTKLSNVNVSSNQLTSLNLSGCTGLGYLYAYSNQLSRLDLSNCTGVTTLNLAKNQLQSLDVSKLARLEIINCSENRISVLDFSNCKNISQIFCEDNPLIALRISGCSGLKELTCHNNMLSSLNISGCPKLYKLTCTGSKLAILDISKLPNLVDTVLTGTKTSISGGRKYSKAIDYQNHTIQVSDMTSILTGDNPFTDNKNGKFYYQPVLWAYYHDPQITTGTDTTHFSPNKNCTRCQVVTFLWRANGCPEPKTTENPFTDIKAKAYYYKAVLWAVENGITTGLKDDAGNPTGKFDPDGTCTRGQVVTFLYRASGSPAVSTGTNPFKDVKSDKFYYKAVLWAVENNITTGTKDANGNPTGKFEPGGDCTRGQVVTFLFRNITGKAS